MSPAQQQRRERPPADRMADVERQREASGLGSKRGHPSPPSSRSVSSDAVQDTQRPCLDSIDGLGSSKSVLASISAAPAASQPIIICTEEDQAWVPSHHYLPVADQLIGDSLASTPSDLRDIIASLMQESARRNRRVAALEADLIQAEAALATSEASRMAANQHIVELSMLLHPQTASASALPHSPPPPPLPPPAQRPNQPKASTPPTPPPSAPKAKTPSYAEAARSSFDVNKYVEQQDRSRFLRVGGVRTLKGKRGQALITGLVDFFRVNLGISVKVVKAIVLPSGHYYVELASTDQAQAAIKARRLLKGTGFGVFDVLSREEQAAHDYLWPTFVAARKCGHSAQFQRASLVVSSRNADSSIRHIKIWAPPFPSFPEAPQPA